MRDLNREAKQETKIVEILAIMGTETVEAEITEIEMEIEGIGETEIREIEPIALPMITSLIDSRLKSFPRHFSHLQTCSSIFGQSRPQAMISTERCTRHSTQCLQRLR